MSKQTTHKILEAKNTWADTSDYEKVANELATVFVKNFEQFKEYANEEILASAPKIKTVANKRPAHAPN